MKKLILISTLLLSTQSFAAGTWECVSPSFEMRGTYSSAGYSVTGFAYKGIEMKFTTAGIFADSSTLMVEIKDELKDQTLATVKSFKAIPTAADHKALSAEWVSAGMVTLFVDTPNNQAVYCHGSN